MDLSYGGRYEAFRNETRRFVEAHAHLAPKGLKLDREKTQVWQRLLVEHGYLARSIPKKYGGYGAAPDILEEHLIAEEPLLLNAAELCVLGEEELMGDARPLQRHRPHPRRDRWTLLR